MHLKINLFHSKYMIRASPYSIIPLTTNMVAFFDNGFLFQKNMAINTNALN